ncbi:MAG: HAD family hydrolase [Chitinivibrionales bacterium]|nr:HAD family hydrolase [Chitinivibrionales bacterium]
MPTKGLIFDLDGTLVDTLADLTDSMNAALEQLGRPERSPDECRRFIGHGLRKYAERALGPEHVDLTESLIQRMVAHYRGNCLSKTAPYPGMKETIDTLAARGLRLAVLTNKNQAPSETITRYFFPGTFDPIVGAVDGRTPKPDPQTTLDIITGWGLEIEEVLFVGDSEADVQTAQNAGIKCIACQWGFRDKDILRAAGAQILIHHPQQILDWLGIAGLPSAK